MLFVELQPLPPDIRRGMLEQSREDVLATSALTGIDLSGWLA